MHVTAYRCSGYADIPHHQIDVLRRLNYRGSNVTKITEDKVVEELLKA